MLPDSIRVAVERLVPRLPDLPAACSLFFLNAGEKLFLRVHISDSRPPHLWLGTYLAAYTEELSETEYLVFARRGRRADTRDLFLVSVRSSAVYTLHVTATGRMSWQEADADHVLVRTLRNALR
jgi:hypothetical protein